jgi:hypothetical protein
MRNNYNAADSAKGMGNVIITGSSRKAVQHNYTGVGKRKLCRRPHDFAIDV